jgi:spoIIIJ-associated protein
MKKIVASGKTIEEAVRNGLAMLEAKEEQVTVHVLEQPSKGLFGLIGTRDAKVELSLIPVPEAPIQEEAAAAIMSDAAAETTQHSAPNKGGNAEEALAETEHFLRDVAKAMGLSVDVDRQTTKDGLQLAMSGPGDIGMLIGRRGQTLDALQYLANIIANRHSDSHLRIVLDAEDFRERRRKTLEELSNRLAGRVARTREEVVLEPMSPHERKIIHSQLQNHPKVKTHSKGDEPNRRIVISPK